jgi:FAD/FMN-containing dehydrogenase
MSQQAPSTNPTSFSIPKLQAEFTGRLVSPNDTDYDQLRTVFYGGIDKKPAIIILAENSTDVRKAISFAQTHKLELAVRSGGHSFAGFCGCDGGVVLDLRKMKKLEIDASSKTAWAEAGLTAGEFTKAADKYDLAVGFGDTGSVGIGGITLGGGVGFLVRKFGMAIDNLLAAEVVTADGQLLQVDAENHPDLFWAIRGGGGNFGVVTRFKFQLHPVSNAYGGMLILPASPEVLVKYMEEAAKAPDELSSIVNIMPSPPMPMVPAEYHGKLIMMALMMYVGEKDAAEQALTPFRALAQPIADLLHPMRYAEIFQPDDGSYHPTAASHTMLMKEIDTEIATKIIDRLQACDAQMRVVQFRTLGGAMARVPVEATAFAHRSSKIMVNVAAFYQGPEDQKVREAWVADFAQLLDQGDDGAYVGFLGPNDASRTANAYPSTTFKRLSVIKSQYDPTNFFHLNQNIEPAKE